MGYFWVLYALYWANDSKVLFSMLAIARVRLCTHMIQNKLEAIARALIHLLCLDAERSFGRSFVTVKESKENVAVIFVASTSVVFSGCLVRSFVIHKGSVCIFSDAPFVVGIRPGLVNFLGARISVRAMFVSAG